MSGQHGTIYTNYALSAVGASAPHVRLDGPASAFDENGQTVQFTFSGTFNAVAVIEKSRQLSGPWTPVATVSSVMTVEVLNRSRFTSFVRVRMSERTSGTMLVTAVGGDDIQLEHRKPDGDVWLRILDSGPLFPGGIEFEDLTVTGTLEAGAIPDVEAAIQANVTALAAHIANPTDAHDASAISVVGAGFTTLPTAVNDVQELADEVDAALGGITEGYDPTVSSFKWVEDFEAQEKSDYTPGDPEELNQTGRWFVYADVGSIAAIYGHTFSSDDGSDPAVGVGFLRLLAASTTAFIRTIGGWRPMDWPDFELSWRMQIPAGDSDTEWVVGVGGVPGTNSSAHAVFDNSTGEWYLTIQGSGKSPPVATSGVWVDPHWDLGTSRWRWYKVVFSSLSASVQEMLFQTSDNGINWTTRITLDTSGDTYAPNGSILFHIEETAAGAIDEIFHIDLVVAEFPGLTRPSETV